jgi:DNA replication ATP-dependent helicase Dna2
MNQDIMLLSNKLIYDDRLKCGNEWVARRALELPNRPALGLVHKRIKRQVGGVRCREIDGRGCWLEHLVDPRHVFPETLHRQTTWQANQVP